MVKIGDNIMTNFGIGKIENIIKGENGRFIIIGEFKVRIAIKEGDEQFEVVK